MILKKELRMNKQELIEEIEDLKDLKKLFGNNPNYIEIDKVIELISKLDEPEPIKLRDVIARIKKLDIGTRKVWLNEILNELGSDYRALIYKNGYEQGKLEGLIEREIVTVPRFVADWIEYFKNCKGTLYGSTNPFSYYGRAILEDFEGDYEEVLRWIRDNSDTYARAWLDGYTVEKNKRYFVRLKGVVDNLRLLRHNSPTNTWTIGSEEQCFNVSRAHTRKELEEAGFEEVFNSPLFEVKEVEG